MRSGTVHRVGLTAATLGLPSLVGLSFAILRGSRIQTGEGVSLLRAAGPGGAALLVGLWALIAALSLRGSRGPLAAAARGAAASGVIIAIAALSAAAARTLAAGAGQFARVSIGEGAWASALAAVMVVLSARREAGASTPLGVALAALAPGGVAALLVSGRLGSLGIMREYANVAPRFWTEVAAHAGFSLAAAAIASVAGVGLGIAAFRAERVRRPLFAAVSLLQTIPGLAMIGLLVAPLAALSRAVPWLRETGFGGLGWAPVITALALYALLPIVRNTYAGLRGVPADTIEAGRGMGMSEGQLMRRLRLPIAAPVLSSGVRVAVVQAIGNATLGAFAAAGTLGLFVFGGLAQQSTDLVLLGSISIVALAVTADGVLRLGQRLVTPRHLRDGKAAL